MPRVVLIVSSVHGDHLLMSAPLETQAAQDWLKKIDVAMGAATSTVETDWATVRKDKVVGAYLSDI